jgi:hypothetical protein
MTTNEGKDEGQDKANEEGVRCKFCEMMMYATHACPTPYGLNASRKGD